jgi:putative transcriptional regulator
MRSEAFELLARSVRQAGRIRRGHLKPSRGRAFEPQDVKGIRSRLKLSQTDFAMMIGVSVATLRNWEQGRRRPDGPALALLRVTAADPKAVAKALSGPAHRGAA